jgi:hypothetical protein
MLVVVLVVVLVLERAREIAKQDRAANFLRQH